ncbi:MAG: hypothetical protein ABIU09_09010 [Pyrinomonadaceae bacterium]
MRAPNENLDDFMKPAAARKPAGPPPVRRLRPSGMVIVLKPLAHSEELAKREAATGSWYVRLTPWLGGYTLSWFHRSLAVGGAIASIAFFLGIGIPIGIYGPPNGPAGSLSDLGVDQKTEAFLPSPKGHDGVDLRAETSPLPISDELRDLRPSFYRRTATARAVTAAYVRARLSRRPKLILTNFVPTTLIIYPENGQIKMRIEPQLTSGYKRTRRSPIS